RVERGEFLNAGVVLFSPGAGFLEARIELDRARLTSPAPPIDCDLVQSYLDVIPKVCAGGGEAGSIGALPQRARFHWLVAPRRPGIPTSAAPAGESDPRDTAR